MNIDTAILWNVEDFLREYLTECSYDYNIRRKVLQKLFGLLVVPYF